MSELFDVDVQVLDLIEKGLNSFASGDPEKRRVLTVAVNEAFVGGGRDAAMVGSGLIMRIVMLIRQLAEAKQTVPAEVFAELEERATLNRYSQELRRDDGETGDGA